MKPGAVVIVVFAMLAIVPPSPLASARMAVHGHAQRVATLPGTDQDGPSDAFLARVDCLGNPQFGRRLGSS